MSATRAILGSLLAVLSLSLPASAQVAGIRWQQDIESARAVAQQTGKLVLVHFWTPSCSHCQVLEQQVFNQPNVAGAIEARFVPVKLNANEHSATAQRLGLTSVPSDYILTPQGQVVGKMTSPNTPTAYVASMIQAANRYSSLPGGAFQNAAAGQPAPAQSAGMNPAYASLSINAPPPQTAAVTQNPYIQPGNPAALAAGQAPAAGVPAAAAIPGQPAVSPDESSDRPSMLAQAQAAAARMASIATAPLGSRPTTQENPYANPPSAPLGGVAATGSVVGPHSAGVNAATRNTANGAAYGPVSAAPGVQAGSQSPPAMPPLGFEGYCPVSMKRDWKWVAGNPQWGIQHRGRLYLFASEAAKREFWNNPDFYSPVLSGLDPVLALDAGQYVEGLRAHSLEHEGLFYMFSSEESLQRFRSNPGHYMAGVLQAMGAGGAATR